jgi:molybdate/tungstate transport system substrate-binding protein
MMELSRHRGVTPRSARLGALLAISCIGLAAAGCGSSSSGASGSSSASGAPGKTGTVNVAYAASLEFLNEKMVSPAFTKAEGYTFSGRAGASGELESDIAAGEITPNVFESVGGSSIEPLFPKFTKWYVQYAGTSIVVAYNPKSKYASQFKAIAAGTEPLRNLFTLMETPGFRLGRTDPNTDPQGANFVEMLQLAQSFYQLPSNTETRILGGADNSPTSPQIFAEASLDSTLQSGQLDASSAYITQAVELDLPYITLPPQINLGDVSRAAAYKKASVTVTTKGKTTVKKGSPQVMAITIIGKPTPAAIAFVRYTLSQAGLGVYRRGGFATVTPTAFGSTRAIPAAVRSELGS